MRDKNAVYLQRVFSVFRQGSSLSPKYLEVTSPAYPLFLIKESLFSSDYHDLEFNVDCKNVW